MDKRMRLEIEIGRYVDGEMTATERAAIERRFEAEPELRRLADELGVVRTHVAEAVGDAAGPVRGERIWRGVAEGITAHRPSPVETFLGGLRFFFRPRLAAAVATAVVVVGLIVLVANMIGPRQEPDQVAEGPVAEGPAVSGIEYGENLDVVVSVFEDPAEGVAVVWIDGIDTSEVN